MFDRFTHQTFAEREQSVETRNQVTASEQKSSDENVTKRTALIHIPNSHKTYFSGFTWEQ